MFVKKSLITFLLLFYFIDNNNLLLLCEPISDFSECGFSEFEPNLDNFSKLKIGINHVYKGKAVEDDKSFPWMVRLSYGTSICSGTIIGPRHILTAKHCTKHKEVSEDQIVIAYGAVNAKNLLQISGVNSVKRFEKVSAEIENVKAEEQKEKLLKFDLAIIELKEPIAFTETVRPICLLEYGSEELSPIIVVGWGRTTPYCSNLTTAGPSDELMYGQMKIVETEKCRPSDKPKMTVVDDYGNQKDDDKIVCVQPEPSIIENGDSGGPLMGKIGKNNNIWVQLGVASSTTCHPTNPPETNGLTSNFASIVCAFVDKATNGEVKCQKGEKRD